MSAARPAPVDRDSLATVLDPTGSGRMLPRSAYTDDAVLAWEREQFFARTWLCAGRVSDLTEPGQRRGASVAGVRAGATDVQAANNRQAIAPKTRRTARSYRRGQPLWPNVKTS